MIETVRKLPGLVAYWDFAEEPGAPRCARAGDGEHALTEVGAPIARRDDAPGDGHAAAFNGSQYLVIPHEKLGSLNIGGPGSRVSMFAVVRVYKFGNGVSIAGVWDEGRGAHDDTGTRQYVMLLNMPTYGGAMQLCPHVSGVGGVSHRADGTTLPWCADYAATVTKIPADTWLTVGFTYDGAYLRAYYNGTLEERALDPVADKRDDPYFTQEGPGGGDRGMNPYYYGRDIFRYDPAKHAASKPRGGSDFTVGARNAVGSMLGEALHGDMAGLAVFNTALSDVQMRALHDAADVA